MVEVLTIVWGLADGAKGGRDGWMIWGGRADVACERRWGTVDEDRLRGGSRHEDRYLK